LIPASSENSLHIALPSRPSTVRSSIRAAGSFRYWNRHSPSTTMIPSESCSTSAAISAAVSELP
jgi:hypothetical protein